jgi:HPt (histidine-containing phosphotransfer) domain-containing protein
MDDDVKSEEVPLFDRTHLSRYTGGDLALEVELVGLMCDQAERCIARMADASDAKQFRDAAHTLKGAARGVGAFALAAACERAEAASGARRAEAGEEVATRYAETRTAFADSGVLPSKPSGRPHTP